MTCTKAPAAGTSFTIGKLTSIFIFNILIFIYILSPSTLLMPAFQQIRLASLFCALILVLSCKNNSKSQLDKPRGDTCSISCPVTGYCTDQFEHVIVKIMHADSTALKVDRYYTVRDEDQAIIDIQSHTSPFEDSVRRSYGNYPVLSDLHTLITDPCGKVFFFVGIKDSVEIIRERYVIAHDCCHILLLSGKTKIVK
jgi:hypothetical protein